MRFAFCVYLATTRAQAGFAAFWDTVYAQAPIQRRLDISCAAYDRKLPLQHFGRQARKNRSLHL